MQFNVTSNKLVLSLNLKRWIQNENRENRVQWFQS